MTVKASMPALCKQLKKLPWTVIPATSAVSTGRGRRARRTVTRKGSKTVGVVYLMTSDRDADPAALAAWVRGHREIGNRLAWVRDATYQEDKSLVRTGNAPRCDGLAAQPGHRPAALGRPGQHRRR
jgi:predicted transposase YbfD/YdcC